MRGARFIAHITILNADVVRFVSRVFQALLSALSDVQRVMPDAKLVEASPDLVGLTDIANLLGFSRQYMRKLLSLIMIYLIASKA
jgi:hypothetical protein